MSAFEKSSLLSVLQWFLPILLGKIGPLVQRWLVDRVVSMPESARSVISVILGAVASWAAASAQAGIDPTVAASIGAGLAAAGHAQLQSQPVIKEPK